MIGIIGAGQIVTSAHLPAYRALALSVRSIYDTDADRCIAVAGEAGVAAAHSLDAVLNDPEVEIVDVAVIPVHSAEIVEAALKAGKHVLAQKPLAQTIARARQLVGLATERGRYLVVNQQMRFSLVVKAIRDAMADGRLGSLTHLSFHIELPLPAGDWDYWLARDPRPVISLNTIHLLDSARFLMGEPLSVRAWTHQDRTHLRLAGETEAVIEVEFPYGRRLSIVDRRNAFDDLKTDFRAEGERGAIRGELGMWTNYPVGVDDRIEFRSAESGSDWEPLAVSGRWVPDAFTGPISELVRAIRTGSRPGTDGQDNLRTLALVDACYESAATDRRIVMAAGSTRSTEDLT